MTRRGTRCPPSCPCLRPRPMAAEMREKIGAANRGHPVSAEAREKIGAARRGLKRSPETLARMSAAHQGQRYWRRMYPHAPVKGPDGEADDGPAAAR